MQRLSVAQSGIGGIPPVGGTRGCRPVNEKENFLCGWKFFFYGAKFPGRHEKLFFKQAVEVGQIVKTDLLGDLQNGFIGSFQFLKSLFQTETVKIMNKAGSRYLPEPAHKVAGAVTAYISGFLHREGPLKLFLNKMKDHF